MIKKTPKMAKKPTSDAAIVQTIPNITANMPIKPPMSEGPRPGFTLFNLYSPLCHDTPILQYDGCFG